MERIKPQPFLGDSCLSQEPKKTLGAKLRQACEAALVSMDSYGSNQNCGKSLLIPKDIERRKVVYQYKAEDPIRTMMFLGSWSHT
ncbi:hypothetical protein CsatB_005427 [Cannabis sativa]